MNSASLPRLLAWGLALTLVALPIIGVLNGWFAAERWPVRYVRVEAEFAHLSAEQIRATAVVHLTDGFFAVKLDEVQRAVAALPWVEKAEARKHWPDTIELRVVEQQPLARWRSDRLINRSGALFAVPGTEGLQGLPLLAGPDNQLAAVIEFYSHSQHDFIGSGLNVTGVELSDRGSWKLALSNGAEIVLGREQAAPRLRRFLAVLPRLLAARGNFERADLRYSNGFAITWPTVSLPVALPKKPQAAAMKVIVVEAQV